MGQLEDMQVFIRVVEAGGISRAAEQLDMAKSAVSRRLSRLEERLGTRLLRRTTRSSKLTAAGQRYYSASLRLLDDVSELNATTSEENCDLAGTLRLAAPLSFSLTHLAPALDEFVRMHPQLRLEIDFSDRQIDLIEEGFELGLRIGTLQDSSLVARRICPIRVVLCASPDYLAREGTPQTPEDLGKHKLLRYSMRGGTNLEFSDASGQKSLVKMNSPISANNGDFLKQMAVAGHGIIVSPSFITWQCLARKELLPILEKYSLPDVNAYGIYPENRFLSRRARLLLDFLIERFGDNPYWDQAY